MNILNIWSNKSNGDRRHVFEHDMNVTTKGRRKAERNGKTTKKKGKKEKQEKVLDDEPSWGRKEGEAQVVATEERRKRGSLKDVVEFFPFPIFVYDEGRWEFVGEGEGGRNPFSGRATQL